MYRTALNNSSEFTSKTEAGRAEMNTKQMKQTAREAKQKLDQNRPNTAISLVKEKV